MRSYQNLSGPELVAEYNRLGVQLGIAGFVPVTRFADRKSGVRRVEALAEKLAERKPAKKAAEPKPAPAAKVAVDDGTWDIPACADHSDPAVRLRASAAIAKIDEQERAAAAARAAELAEQNKDALAKRALKRQGFRVNSKHVKVLEMVKRPEGATEQEICDAIGWVQCLATMGRVIKKAGLAVRKEKDPKTNRTRYWAVPKD